MGSSADLFLLPAQPKQPCSCRTLPSFPRRITTKNRFILPVARLFRPSIFEESKMKVVFLGVDGEKHPGRFPRAYTLTHSDITSMITLAVSNTINRAQLQGWYNRLQRDEVVAEWRKMKGRMSLHVHCHISGDHFLLNLIAKLRYYIFSNELPVVLKAFVHGDGNLFSNYPELEEAKVWVYFHSNIPEFNKVECWGPLRHAASVGQHGKPRCSSGEEAPSSFWAPAPPQQCQEECKCCFPPYSLILWSHASQEESREQHKSDHQLQRQQ